MVVALAEALEVLAPSAIPGRDWIVQDTGTGATIVFWNPALGTQPNQAALDAVTQAQVDAARTAKLRAVGVALLADPAGAYKLLRAAFDVARDEVNILRRIVVGVGSAVWDPASIASGAGLNSPNVTVTGAAFGDVVEVMAPYSLQGLTCTGSLISANTITARLENQTGASVNLASGTWNFVVLRWAAMPDRTLPQFKTAITNRVNDGTVDT